MTTKARRKVSHRAAQSALILKLTRENEELRDWKAQALVGVSYSDLAKSRPRRAAAHG